MNDNTTSLIALLKKVEQIRLKHELAAKLTGENFNIFEILGLNSLEVRTHSAFIAELLDPGGVHGQDDTFLRLFLGLEAIKSHLDDFGYGLVTVKVEHPICAINEGITEGGRIDILLKDSNGKHLIIENKIYARDQPNQLLRYYNFDPKPTLLYLTLFGTKPDVEPPDYVKYHCISYSRDILVWLDECYRASVALPVIRETIFQYINLISRLTHQTSGEKMKDDIIKTITENPELAGAVALMTEAWATIYNKTVEDCRTQMACIKKSFPIDERITLERDYDVSDKDDGVWIGFRAIYHNESNAPATAEADEYAKILKEIDKTGTARIAGEHWKVGLFNPKPFETRAGFENLPKKDLVQIYNDHQSPKRFVSGIIEQADDITNQLRERIRSLKKI